MKSTVKKHNVKDLEARLGRLPKERRIMTSFLPLPQ